MQKKKSVFRELNANFQKYGKDYKGFIERSEYIERREYKDKSREEKNLEVLKSYGAF